jgi:hypothetical protein
MPLHPFLRRAAAIALLWGTPTLTPLLSQGTSPLGVSGDVIAREGQVALGHSMVSLEPVGRQTFTSDEGAFVFREVAPGNYRLRITHIGFAPKEITVTVGPDGRAAPVIVALEHIIVRLTAVRVLAYPPCLKPGPPSAKDSPDFAIVFDQLHQNADQFRLLADSFPYVYQMQRVQRTTFNDATIRHDGTDSLLVTSNADNGRRYRPGDVVRNVGGRREFSLPTLRDFASPDFLKNHCFHDAGIDTTGATPQIRIDFEAADRIRDPDVHGSIFLDATTYRITRAELELSRIPNGFREILSVRVTTLFSEVVPSIVVMSEVHAETRMRMRAERAALGPQADAALEDQRIVRFVWLTRDPRKGP